MPDTDDRQRGLYKKYELYRVKENETGEPPRV